ncbi:hypothetical protein PUN28_004830 [Cardiocondyla obscurior]|uniref:Ribosomal protein S15 n=1 Tax=Cardiocondyla obscurior TaxID=286306 RepID=A0AAW2GDB2_9HYME
MPNIIHFYKVITRIFSKQNFCSCLDKIRKRFSGSIRRRQKLINESPAVRRSCRDYQEEEEAQEGLLHQRSNPMTVFNSRVTKLREGIYEHREKAIKIKFLHFSRYIRIISFTTIMRLRRINEEINYIKWIEESLNVIQLSV